MELNTQFFEIGTLVDEIKNGKLVLPEFQRDFEWKPAAIADLMRTIIRKWPAGTLLFLKSDGALVLAPKAIELGPDPSGPTHYILDGQQRLTSVFHVFEEQGDEIYYLKLGDVVEAGEFEDEHLVYEKKSKFHKKFGSVEKRASEFVLELGGVRDEVRFGEWCDYLPKEKRQAFREARSKILGGLVNYRFPALVLEKDIPLLAVAKIFETINKTGIQLGFLDLMVAKLYPLDFRLRDHVDEARNKYSILRQFSFTGEEVIQLVALREHFRLSAERQGKIAAGEKSPPPVKVKGIRKGDMLALDPETVKLQWDGAVSDYVQALEWLRKRCGVMGDCFLPAEAMLIPLADALSQASPRPGFEADLEAWFWCSTFAQTYAQGANTQALRDARELRAWRESAGAVASTVKELRESGIDKDLLLESRKRNEMALRGIMALVCLHDARDWLTAQAIRDIDPALIDLHHVFPENYLKKNTVAVLDKLVNFTPLLRESNIKLRDIPPSEVVKRNDYKPHTASGHYLPEESFAANNFAKFFEERRERLLKLIKPKIGKT